MPPNTNNHNSANDILNLLHTMPKKCLCNACQELKSEAKNILGEKKFSQIANQLQIAR